MDSHIWPYERLIGVIGTSECSLWREKIFRRHPSFMGPLVDHYEQIANDRSYVEANHWLRLIHERMKLGSTGLFLDSSEEELDQYARVKAKTTELDIHDAYRRLGSETMLTFIQGLVERTGLTFPLAENPTKEDKVDALAHVCDEAWWRHSLRVWQWREMEALCRELMVRMRGFEEFAKHSDTQWTGLFFTVTCPSKFHAVHQSGKANQKFNGATPRQGNDYLNNVWQKTRAAWHRQGIHVFGFRVVEPHHDGTPHWHLMLFIDPAKAALATSIFRQYALEVDGEEPGAQEYRFKAVTIDPAKGSATGYIAKYISKNIDGYGVDCDQYGRDAVVSALRIEAWASLWGIRQFQQIGGPSVTVWRELRRLELAEIDNALLKAITKAADEGDWEKYTSLMGGAVCRRKERPIRPMLLQKPERNRYGRYTKVLKGLIFAHRRRRALPWSSVNNCTAVNAEGIPTRKSWRRKPLPCADIPHRPQEGSRRLLTTQTFATHNSPWLRRKTKGTSTALLGSSAASSPLS